MTCDPRQVTPPQSPAPLRCARTMGRPKKRASAGDEAAVAEKAREVLRTDRLARRWAAVVLKLIGGWTDKQVHEEVGASASRTSAWTAKLAEQSNLDDAPRERASTVTESDLKIVQAELQRKSGEKKPHTSLRRALPKAIQKSARSAHRTTYARQLKKAGWAVQAVKRVPKLTLAHCPPREKFCRRHYKFRSRDTLITDSKMWQSHSTYSSKLGTAWAPKGQPVVASVTQKSPFVMHTYAGMCHLGATPLKEVTGTTMPAQRPRGRPRKRAPAPAAAPPAEPAPEAGKKKRGVDSAEYREVVIPFLLDEGSKLFQKQGIERWYFQHDGAGIHTVADSPQGNPNRAAIEKGAIVLENWPSRSPDLSPIERLWAQAEDQLKLMEYDDLASFKRAVHEAWARVATPAR